MARKRIIKNPGAKSIPILKKQGYKKAGPKYGRSTYVMPKAKVTPPPAPASPPGPYDEYKTTAPWAIPGFQQIDRDQAAHQSYVADKVQPWLSESLKGIQGYQDAAQSNYLGQVQGAVQGAYNQAAAATPQQVSGTTGGAVVAGPNSYLTGAGSQYASQMGSVATQLAANQAYMAKMQPATLSQGFINSLADYAKGLPQLYVQKRTEWRSKVDEAVAQMQAEAAKQEETMRHNRVTEAISAQNAQTQAALGFGNLGLSATKEGNDQAATTAAAAAPAPYGYFRDVDGNLVRDPSVPQASASSGNGGGTANEKYSPQWMAEKNFVGGWKTKPAKLPAWAKSGFTKGTDGKWYVKRGASTSGGKPSAAQVKAAAGAKAFDVQKALVSAYDSGLIDSGDQNKGTGQLLRFLRQYQPTNKANFNAWWKSVLPVLRDQDPKFAEWMAGYVLRRQRDGSWKGSF